jgi:hypothetical protein
MAWTGHVLGWRARATVTVVPARSGDKLRPPLSSQTTSWTLPRDAQLARTAARNLVHDDARLGDPRGRGRRVDRQLSSRSANANVYTARSCPFLDERPPLEADYGGRFTTTTSGRHMEETCTSPTFASRGTSRAPHRERAGWSPQDVPRPGCGDPGHHLGHEKPLHEQLQTLPDDSLCASLVNRPRMRLTCRDGCGTVLVR